MAKYSKKASDKVKKALHERKRGTLKSGQSGKKVKSRKQAIAIGLAQARRAVPCRRQGASQEIHTRCKVARRACIKPLHTLTSTLPNRSGMN